MLRPLGTVLAGWSPARSGPPHPLAATVAAWPDLVGARVAEHAWPLSLSGSTLLVATGSSAWSQQLQMLSPHILAGLAQLPETAHVERLAFRSGAVKRARAGALPLVRKPPALRRREPAPEEAPDERAALDRLRRRLARVQRAAAAHCSACGAPVERAGPPCAPCAGSAERARRTEVQRLLFAAPWLSHEDLRAHAPACTPDDFAQARRELLARWWAMLEYARRQHRINPNRHERQIASSYVLLQSGLPPDRVTPALLRHVLGDELEMLLRAGRADVDNPSAPK